MEPALRRSLANLGIAYKRQNYAPRLRKFPGSVQELFEKHDEDGGRALKTPGRAVPRGIREDPPPTGTLSGSLSHREQGLRGGVFCSQETVFHLVKPVLVRTREFFIMP